jgi:hypothetical protein
MKAPRKTLSTPLLTGGFALFASLTFSPGILLGGTSPSQETGSVLQTGTSSTNAPAISYRILQQRRVYRGDHSVTYNLVAPPVLPKRSLAAAPTPVTLTSEEEQTEMRLEQKEWKLFTFSAVIYDNRVTEVSWGNQGQYRAYSNIDFNQFCGTQYVETDTTVYDLFFMPFNESSEYDPDTAKRLPSREAFSPTRFEYILDESCPAPPAEDIAALDALHVYYNANSQKLAADYAKRVADQHAQELWRKAHPAVPKDAVVNFWPIKSSVYLGSGNKGEEK